jgi:hypothetical protein
VLQGHGVQQVIASTTAQADVGVLFRRRHWQLTELLYTKWIGGE